MITVETIKTRDGYYGRVVAEGHPVMYTTTVYLTQFMAMADANCWGKFHMEDETYTTCGTCREVTANEGPSNVYVVYCDNCVKGGKHTAKCVNCGKPAAIGCKCPPEYTIDYADTIYESGSKLNTEKVIATITEVNQHPNAAYEVGPLTGLMGESKGWKLRLYMPEGKFWRTFDIIKSEHTA